MNRRLGLTVIEALVTIGIISLLIVLLLPAIQRLREVAMRVESSNQLRQICLGTHHFASDWGLPGLINKGGDSLFVSLLPYVEYDHTYAKLHANGPGQLVKPLDTYVVKLYVSPADPTLANHPWGEGGVTSYAANAQVFTDAQSGQRTLEGTLRDGASNTILFAEHYARCQETTFTWWNSDAFRSQGIFRRATFADSFALISPPYQSDVCPITIGNPPMSVGTVRGLTFQVRPRPDESDARLAQTAHRAGMLVAMGDGSVRALRGNIPEELFWGLVTPASGEVTELD